MRTTFVSTVSLWNSSKSTLDKLQTGLVKANKELVTGREADVGLKLGYRTGDTLSLRQSRAELDALTDSNASTLLRIKSTYRALDNARTTAEKFMGVLIATPLTDGSLGPVQYQAKVNLDGLISGLNVDVAGQYVFGGLNTQEKPLNAYVQGPVPSASKAAIDAAFAAAPPAGADEETARRVLGLVKIMASPLFFHSISEYEFCIHNVTE